ncbi:MAG TPA: hypothetical protein PKE00_12495, partial [Planctomycetota bacterium]|nr:hypothetical protein [Planctomycetota bacterium]
MSLLRRPGRLLQVTWLFAVAGACSTHQRESAEAPNSGMWIDFEGLEEGTIPAALFVEENDVARTQGVRVAAARGYAEGRGIQVETPRASVATLWFSGLSTTKATLSVRLRAIEVTSRFGIVLAPDLVPDPMLRLAERRVSILFDNAARAVVVIDANPESVRELQRVFVP